MIAYEVKQDDQGLQLELLALAEVWMKIYQQKPRENVLERVRSLLDQAEELQEKIDTHDYTEDEERRKRLNKVIYGDFVDSCKHDYKVMPDNSKKCMICSERKTHD